MNSPVTHNPKEDAFYARVDPRKSMTPEAQRIAIAEACGWHRCGPHPNTNSLVGFPKDVEPTTDDWEVVPDYLQDLNAMHEAEKVLRAKRFTFAVYRDWLLKICNPKCDPLSKEWTDEENENAISATTSQRAEAFLKAIGRWVTP